MLTRVRVPGPLKRKLAKKSVDMQKAILTCIRQLRENPHHPGLRVKKLSGTNVFEARVDHRNRITFFWDGAVLVIENHCHHNIVSA